MNVKDEMLADAIKTALDYSYTVNKLKIVIAVMTVAIVLLSIGYFI